MGATCRAEKLKVSQIVYKYKKRQEKIKRRKLNKQVFLRGHSNSWRSKLGESTLMKRRVSND